MTAASAFVAALGFALTAAACAQAPAPPAADQASAPASVAAPYTPPADGTATLVGPVTARRGADGQVSVEGRLLLPAGARVWVDVYAPGKTVDPIGRAELYLGPGGSFNAGPFKIAALSQLHVQFTSHFSRSWQPADVLALVGANGLKLPQSALRPANPQSPQSGGFLEASVTVPIG